MVDIKKYDFFIFDCDGVILDSNAIKNEAFRNTLKNENVKIVDKFIEYHQENGGISRYKKFLFFYKEMKKSKNYSEETKKALMTFSRLVKKELIDSRYVSGIINFLEKIYKTKKKMYIVSGSDEKELISVLKDKKVIHFFQKVLGSPTDKKTNTTMVKKENPSTDNGIYFGDSKLDYLCAKEFNMDFIFVKKFSEWKDFDKYENQFLMTINDFEDVV